MHVPFVDLSLAHKPVRAEIMSAIETVVSENAFAGGARVESFEQAFAAFCGTTHAIGVGSGTEALWFILRALGIGDGDEVITTPCTFIATAEAIIQAGAKPVFVDIDQRTFNLDPECIKSVVTDRTKAILPVHLFGQLAEMERIVELGHDLGIPIIEDASQAHGAQSESGLRAGSFGAAGAFSFYPSKNLGAWGDSGAVVTNDDALANEIRALREHGQVRKYIHSKLGWNGRMDGIQAAVLEIKLRDLEAKNEARRSIADRYEMILKECPGIVTPVCESRLAHVFHIYSLLAEDRDTAKLMLEKEGVECGIHYPIPLHLQAACKSSGMGKGSLPLAERCSNRFLSLPIYPEMSDEKVEYVGERLIGLLDVLSRS